uniref:Uncharacterized protein n=1 Tax=Caenorhabditis japonica TaxID=281687 RepID=A0A8R1EKR0_CAEJA
MTALRVTPLILRTLWFYKPRFQHYARLPGSGVSEGLQSSQLNKHQHCKIRVELHQRLRKVRGSSRSSSYSAIRSLRQQTFGSNRGILSEQNMAAESRSTTEIAINIEESLDYESLLIKLGGWNSLLTTGSAIGQSPPVATTLIFKQGNKEDFENYRPPPIILSISHIHSDKRYSGIPLPVLFSNGPARFIEFHHTVKPCFVEKIPSI